MDVCRTAGEVGVAERRSLAWNSTTKTDCAVSVTVDRIVPASAISLREVDTRLTGGSRFQSFWGKIMMHICLVILNMSLNQTRQAARRRGGGPPDAYTGYGMKGRSGGLRVAPRCFPRCTRIAWADIIRRIAEDGRLVVSLRACGTCSRRCRGRRV